MPQVKVKQSFAGDKKKVYTAVKTYLKGRDTLSKLGAEIEWDDKTHSAEISGGAFEGGLAVTEKAGKSEVEITVQLPLLMTPFKGKVEEELKKHLGRVEV